jgi:hypothetical protein
MYYLHYIRTHDLFDDEEEEKTIEKWILSNENQANLHIPSVTCGATPMKGVKGMKIFW